MYEFVKTEKGWKICWGGAGLYGTKSEPAPRPVIRVVETLSAELSDEREPARALSA
jgi:hypothetical protein